MPPRTISVIVELGKISLTVVKVGRIYICEYGVRRRNLGASAEYWGCGVGV